jgi:hypothetical protein
VKAAQNKPILVRQVFVPGGFPKYTYQKRDQYKIEDKLTDALNRLNKFIAVAGPTKSGKTVLVQKVVPESDCVWIDSGHISSVQDVWDLILSELELPSTIVESRSQQKEDTATLEIEAGFKPGGIGAATKNQDSSKTSKAAGKALTFQKSGAKSTIAALTASSKILVIDDFHYLSQEIQSSLIRALKPAVFKGLQVVILLIPHRMHQAALAEMDVDGRTHTIPIPEWQPDELFSIAESGFKTLRLQCSATTIDSLVRECFASPHIMQDFCSSLCAAHKINHAYIGNPPLPSITIPQPPENFFKELALSISPEAFKALRKGPERTNRKPRDLTTGGTVDTYEAVLLALHELEGATPIDWAKMRRALQGILKEVPQQHEVTRALENMYEIAREREGEPVIDYVQGELHLVDPFFRFFLKWNTSIRDESVT